MGFCSNRICNLDFPSRLSVLSKNALSLYRRFPLDAQSDGALFFCWTKRLVSQRYLSNFRMPFFGGYSKGMAFFDMMSDAQVSLQGLLRSVWCRVGMYPMVLKQSVVEHLVNFPQNSMEIIGCFNTLSIITNLICLCDGFLLFPLMDQTSTFQFAPWGICGQIWEMHCHSSAFGMKLLEGWLTLGFLMFVACFSSWRGYGG